MEYYETIKNIIDGDMKKFVVGPELGFERLYIFQLANNWVQKNVKTQEDFDKKLKALKEIIYDKRFVEAIDLGNEAYNMNLDEEHREEKKEQIEEKALEAAKRIAMIRKSENYIKKSKEAGYEILEKYENPNYHIENPLKEQMKIVEELCEYLLEKQRITKKDKRDDSSNERG